MHQDLGTTRFYNAYAATLCEATESRRSAMLPFILSAVDAGSSVLDVGAGSGRDVAAMLKHGLDAFGVEPNDAMRALAHASHPQLVGRLHGGSLPGLGRPFVGERPDGFDAVVCSAVLMHVHADQLEAALTALWTQLRGPHGSSDGPSPLMFISLPQMTASRLTADRDPDGRAFFNHSPDGLERLLAGRGMVLKRKEVSEAALQGSGTLWHTLVFQRAD